RDFHVTGVQTCALPILPAATAGGDYAVNFGAYGSRADAGTVVNRLRQSNLPAYVEETRVGDRDAWRVRIGPYASRADAESARVRSGERRVGFESIQVGA